MCDKAYHFEGSCDEDLLRFYNIDATAVEWIKASDYINASIEDVRELQDLYTIFLCTDEPDKLFLIPKTTEGE